MYGTTEHSGLWLFEAGMAYWYGLDFKKEDAGNSDALCSLGECVSKREKDDQNLPKAMELYEQSAQMGFSRGMCNLANCHENGRGVTCDERFIQYAKQEKWYGAPYMCTTQVLKVV